MTKREILNYVIENYANDEVLVNYANHEIELLDKKKASATKTKTQVENEKIKETIVYVLKDNAREMTITEIQENNGELKELSNQKMSALLRQLVQDEIVKKSVDKKKAYFSIMG